MFRSIFGDAGRDYTLEVDERRKREAEAKLGGLTAGAQEEETFGPQIPAEFREPRSEPDDDVFGPQIPAEFRDMLGGNDEDVEMGERRENVDSTFGPSIPDEFRRPRTPSDEGLDEEEEYRRQIEAAFVAPVLDEGPKHVKTDYFGKLVVDGREIEEEGEVPAAGKIAELVRTVAGESAAAELGPRPEVAGFREPEKKGKPAKRRFFEEDEADYYTGLGGNGYDYDSDEEDPVNASATIDVGKDGRDGKERREKREGAPKRPKPTGKEVEAKKKKKLNNELQEVDKKLKEKFGVSLAGKGK